jgi:hypothetical protein
MNTRLRQQATQTKFAEKCCETGLFVILWYQYIMFLYYRFVGQDNYSKKEALFVVKLHK